MERESKKVVINFLDVIDGQKTYNWECPSCEGNFSYSNKINNMWGHPEDKVFCAVCCEYYDMEEASETPVN